jgi:hypothetical protein
MPDQQARPDEDPWEAAETGTRRADGPGTTAGQGDRAGPVPDESLPDTDEAGTGRRGAPRAATVNPEHPVPDESPG